MENVVATNTIKGAGQTVFLDLKRAKNDTLYLSLTTLGKNQTGEDQRRTVTIWQPQIVALRKALQSITRGQKIESIKNDEQAGK